MLSSIFALLRSLTSHIHDINIVRHIQSDIHDKVLSHFHWKKYITMSNTVFVIQQQWLTDLTLIISRISSSHVSFISNSSPFIFTFYSLFPPPIFPCNNLQRTKKLLLTVWCRTRAVSLPLLQKNGADAFVTRLNRTRVYSRPVMMKWTRSFWTGREPGF